MGDDALQILRGILEYSQLPITITDLEGRLQLFSRAAEDLSGYSSEEVLGRHASMLFPRKWRVPTVFAKALEKGALEDVRGFLRCKDGRVIPISLYMTVVHDVLGRPAGFLAVTKDLSEQRQLEGQLEEAHIKEDFFTDLICHDVRNYDQTLLGYMDLILEGALGPLDEEAEKLARRSRQDAYELKEFIERIRVLAGREPGGDLPSMPVDISSVLQSIEGRFRGRTGDGGRLLLSDETAENCTVRADPLIERLLQDLVEFIVDLGARHGCGPCRVSLDCEEDMVHTLATLEQCEVPEDVPELGAPDLHEQLAESSEVFVLRGLAEQFGGHLRVEESSGRPGVVVRLSLRVWSDSQRESTKGVEQ